MSLDDLIQNEGYLPAIRIPLITEHPNLPHADRKALENLYRRIATYNPDLLFQHPPEDHTSPSSLSETRRVLHEINRLLGEEQYAPASEGFIRNYYLPLMAVLTGGLIGMALSQEQYAVAALIGGFMSIMTVSEIGRMKRAVRERNDQILQGLARILNGYAAYLTRREEDVRWIIREKKHTLRMIPPSSL